MEVHNLFIDDSLKEFAQVTRSSDPTPGGGSVSAYVGLLGSALTSMVGGLTFGKKGYDDIAEASQKQMESNSKEMEDLFDRLADMVDEDSKAFDQVMKAFKMPKESEADKKKRSEAIQVGYKLALDVPLTCAENCLRVLELQDVFAKHGNVNAITDIGVGILLAYSGMEGALLNVSINLASLKDQDYKKEISEKVAAMLEKGKDLKEENLKVVYERLNS